MYKYLSCENSQKRLIFFAFGILVLLLISCNGNTERLSSDFEPLKMDYIKGTEVYVSNDSLMIDQSNTIQGHTIKYSIKKLPQKWIVFSSPLLYQLFELDELSKVKGIQTVDYIYTQKIRTILKNNDVQQLGVSNMPSIEDILDMSPDLVILEYNNLPLVQLLKSKGISVLVGTEYKESHPLAKTEWIKIVGILSGKRVQAYDKYEDIKKDFFALKKSINKKVSQQFLLADNYGGKWYVPTSLSSSGFYCSVIGGEYLFSDQSTQSSKVVSYEEVIIASHKSKIWVNNQSANTLKEFEQIHPKYKKIAVNCNNQIYTTHNRFNGIANDIFERGAFYANEVLKDWSRIKLGKDSLMYFKRLN